ncbi:MAG: hypothetical protein Q7K57_37440 [Burkholderiaceae bacterium]|nr:hypothetical protein [Burkholderiaceae bacterium]
MNSTPATQALNVYLDAYDCFNNGTSTLVDDVIVALWDEVHDQAQIIREQALKISLLEMKEAQPPLPAGEYAALLGRLGSKP